MWEKAFPLHGTLREISHKKRGNANVEKSIINLLTVVAAIVGLYIVVNAPKSITIKIEIANFKIEINTKKE
jgi:cell division protein FtsL